MAVLGVGLIVWAFGFRIWKLRRAHARGWELHRVWRRMLVSVSAWAGVAVIVASLADSARIQRLAVYLGVAFTTLLAVLTHRARQLRLLSNDGPMASARADLRSDVPPDSWARLRDPEARKHIQQARRIAQHVARGDRNFQRVLETTFQSIENNDTDRTWRQGRRAYRLLDTTASLAPWALAVSCAATCAAVYWLLRQ